MHVSGLLSHRGQSPHASALLMPLFGVSFLRAGRDANPAGMEALFLTDDWRFLPGR